MHIRSVYIERFGQFKERRLALGATSFVTVFGPNEAGKTTLMTFIKAILFGFPKRAELQPYIKGLNEKTEIGGSITVEMDDVGEVVVERFRYKNGGKATVYLPDGKVNDEDVLQYWLTGYNHDIFSSIFCFDLDGLSHLEHLKADDLNHYLFSTGMMGSSNILQLENQLETKAAELFKPSGRVPIINKCLDELGTMAKEIKRWDRELDGYHKMKSDLADLQTSKEQLEAELHDIEEKHYQFIKYQSCEALLVDFHHLNKAIQQTESPAFFPDHGLAQYEHYQAKIVTLEGERAELEQRMTMLKERIAAINVNPTYLDNEEKIHELRREAEFLQSLKPEYQIKQESLRIEQEAYGIQLQKLGFPELTEQMASVQTGFHIKQELKDLFNRYETIRQRKDLLEGTIEELENDIILLQRRCKELRLLTLSDEELTTLNEQAAQQQDMPSLLQEKQWLDRQLPILEKQKRTQATLEKLKYSLSGGLLLIFSLLGLLLLFFGEQLIGGVLIGLEVLLSLLTFWGIGLVKSDLSVSDARQMKHRLAEIDEIINQSSEQKDVMSTLQVEKEKREQLQLEQKRLEEKQKHYQELIGRFEQLVQELNDHLAIINNWAVAYSFPKLENVDLYLDVYELIEQAKEREIRIQHIKQQQEEYLARREAYEQEWGALQEVLDTEKGHPEILEQELNEYKEQYAKRKHLEETLEELNEQKRAILKKIDHYKDECDKLFEKVTATSEKEFYHLAKVYHERLENKKQRDNIWLQICHAVPQKELLNQCLEWFETNRWQGIEEKTFTATINELKFKLSTIQTKISDLHSGIQQIEKTSKYAELFHDFEEKKAELNELAKKWSVYKTAAELLTRAKESYRTTRLPKVLHQASYYMKTITEGKYSRLYFSEEDHFMLEHKSGQMFSIQELSRGTKEQLYVSLRLALAAVFDAPYRLPLIIDDGFVNFDFKRRRNTINLLRVVSAQRQVLFLTCNNSDAIDDQERVPLYSEGVETNG